MSQEVRKTNPVRFTPLTPDLKQEEYPIEAEGALKHSISTFL